ncbi:MAG: extracellular solute-binding protein [Lachnospiraceae bacterium]|nr:extracellular solute-binding protein [Lachnospiraceae bacterium]
MKRKQNLKKKVSMVTAAICAASSLPFAAFAEENAGDNFNLDGTLPIVKNADEMDPIEIAIVIPPERTVPTEDLVMVKKIVEDTGIPIKWVEIPSDGSTEKINLMLNSGDYPDVFWNGITSDIAIQYSDQDLFIPTEDLIEKYCPRLTEIYKERPEYKGGSTAPNGHSYGFPYVEEMYGLVLTPGPFLINKTWLDAVGKDIPTTVDEWVDCLRAFKEAGDLNGNGVDDEVPYSFGMGCDGLFDSYDTFYYFTGAFGSADSVCSGNPQANHLRIVDGKVHFTAADDAFRKTADFFNMLYNENLIDMDSFSPGPNADTPLYISKMAGDTAVIGCLGTWAPVNEIIDPDVRSQYVAIPRLEGEAGKGGVEVNYSEMQDTSMVAITNKCKYPEVVAALVNYCMDPEISVTLNWGPEGYTYCKGDDGILHFNLDENDNIILQDGYQSFTEQRANTTPGRGSLIVLSDYYGTVADYTWDAVDLLEGQKENGKEEIMADIDAVPKMMLTLEEQQKIAQIYPQIANIVDAFQMNGIMQGTTDDMWEQYQNDLKAAGVDDLVATYQEAYDRFCEASK